MNAALIAVVCAAALYLAVAALVFGMAWRLPGRKMVWDLVAEDDNPEQRRRWRRKMRWRLVWRCVTWPRLGGRR